MATLIGQAKSTQSAGFTRSGIPMDVFNAAVKYSEAIVAERRKLYAGMDANDALPRKVIKTRAKQKAA